MRTKLFLPLLLLAAPTVASPDLESLKAATLTAAFQAAVQAPPIAVPAARAKPVRPPAPVRRAEVLTYAHGGYTWESDADKALSTARENLQNAGLAILRGQTTRENNAGTTFGFVIEYVDDAQSPDGPRKVESYESGNYTFQMDAQNALSRAESDMRARGYAVVLGELLQRTDARGDYYYRLDYLGGRRPPPGGQDYVFTSSFYFNPYDAQRAMYATVNNLQAQGYQVLDYQLFQDWRTRYYFYQVRYRGRWARRR